ncbi:MAG: cobalamin-independent methionine synthase II family protein [Chloroflexi bacterium]|nr:cobalamin-independent methionine synthase II family protein [Chloroflexota bacterium]
MLVATKDTVLPTTVVGSYPRPHWYRESLRGRPFKLALADALFREQYLDAVACITGDQARAGLDIVTDGDARFDLDVGGRSWFFYPIERMGGIEGHTDGSPAWQQRFGVRPGHILWEVQEAYQPPRVTGKLARGPLEYAAVWKVAQRVSTKPVKFGAISAQTLTSMLINEYYPTERELIWDLCAIVNEELKEVAAAGCPVIQVEEPGHHFRAQNPVTTDGDLAFLTDAFNREVDGVETEIWAHTCWGNPNQQACYWERPSYGRALEHFWRMKADVITFECASTEGKDLPLLGECPPDKKVAIGVVNHTNTTVEPPEVVANLIRKALRYIPPERLILCSDCGFGREGLSRRIAFYKCVALVQGANLVRRELGLPEAPIAAADARLAFGTAAED